MLQAVQEISALAGFSVFVIGNIVTCRPGVSREKAKQTLDGDTVKNFGKKGLAYTYFSNQVQLGWGAAAIYTATDQESVNKNVGEPEVYNFSTNTGQPLYLSDEASAIYFGSIFLQRSANIRELADMDVDEALMADVTIGDVYNVTAPNWYLDEAPFVVLEVHRDPKSFKISLSMASVPE